MADGGRAGTVSLDNAAEDLSSTRGVARFESSPDIREARTGKKKVYVIYGPLSKNIAASATFFAIRGKHFNFAARKFAAATKKKLIYNAIMLFSYSYMLQLF